MKKINWPLYLDRMTQIAPAYSVGPIILKIPFRLIEQVDMNTYYLVPTYYSPPFIVVLTVTS